MVEARAAAAVAGRRPRVAVLGAGIMGAATALHLAHRNFDVTLIDAAETPMSGASRWNEGKIHLGYLYGADPSMETARRVMTGGLAFEGALRDLVGSDFVLPVGAGDDIYLLHRDSVVDPSAMEAYLARVSGLLRGHEAASRYLADTTHAEARRLSPAELDALRGGDSLVAGFRVPERSVRTTVIADAVVRAIDREPNIEQVMSTRVRGAAPETDLRTRWIVEAEPGIQGTFDGVVNALWQGRLAIDQSVGLTPRFAWSNRYRVSLFIETDRPVAFPSVVIAVGPFGDIKNYDGRHFYVSWYEAGLLMESHDVDPAPPAVADAATRERIVCSIRAGICAELPGAEAIFDAARHVSLEGGWVHAQGQGALDDPRATLHRRDRFGVSRVGTYFSVDTGKYSTAPWMAAELAKEIALAVAG